MSKTVKATLLLIAALAVAAGCIAYSDRRVPEERYEPVGSTEGSIWYLEARTRAEADAEIAGWAERHFGPHTGVSVGDIPDDSTVTGPVTLVRSFDIEIAENPMGRRPVGFETIPPAPDSFYAFVLRDASQRAFVAFGHSFDGGRIEMITLGKVGNFGPSEADFTARGLGESYVARDDWPAKRYLDALAVGGKLVHVAYPQPMHEVFLQVGDEPTTATFVHVGSGHTFVGLDAYFDMVDAAHASLPRP